jgi:nanoRNase/pAp phosphatase (c-di-AMP/oligoRNAs hydrolase)
MMKLIDFCSDHTIDEILRHPDVRERVELYYEQQDLFTAQIKKVHEVVGDVVVLHLKNEDPIFAGNRFYVYAMYPQAKISVHEMWGLKKRNTVFAVGKSIVDRSSDVNIGDICHEYGGGGHKNAGTCQVPNSIAGTILEELLVKLNKK